MPVPPCTCAGPGFCPRYQRDMPGRLFELCQTRADCRQLWDQSFTGAPGESAPAPAAVNDALAHRNGVLAAPAPPRFQPRPDDPPCGVVLGSYALPRLIELQIRLIRDTCGPVPILVADDCSPGFGRPVDPASAYGRLQEVCARSPGVTLWPNVERIGHTGGDVAVFWKGLVWAGATGLRVLAKLSQRFLLDLPRWLQDGAWELLTSRLPLACRRCRGPENFPLRTEGCLLDVACWGRPEVLHDLTPRRYGRGTFAETVLDAALRRHFGGVFWPWDVYSEDRYQSAPGLIWHCADASARYAAVAARYGLSLDPDFHTGGWGRQPNYVYG